MRKIILSTFFIVMLILFSGCVHRVTHWDNVPIEQKNKIRAASDIYNTGTKYEFYPTEHWMEKYNLSRAEVHDIYADLRSFYVLSDWPKYLGLKQK